MSFQLVVRSVAVITFVCGALDGTRMVWSQPSPKTASQQTPIPPAVDTSAPRQGLHLMDQLSREKPRAIDSQGNDVTAWVQFKADWKSNVWSGSITNTATRPIQLREVILVDVAHGLPPTTNIYGEGFTMLAQTGGTLSHPIDEGFYPDRSHYRIAEPDGLRTVYGLMTLQPDPSQHWVLGFTSCRRFIGRFSFSVDRLRVSWDLENLELLPGQSWDLESLVVLDGEDRALLLEKLAQQIADRHPPLFHAPVPTGWCSWYCFGPDVNAQQIRDNLVWSRQNFPQLRYIQIDDGYQPWMGDWLATGKSFDGDVRSIIQEIRKLGFEPAIWVAPFIASPQSALFREHPDWFVKDENGQPLPSDRIGFGGWRLGPWYALDGTHPESQKFLDDLFRTLRQEWGCRYFKLDATYWGAIHGGVHHDRNASRVEAYRRGMEAIRRGAEDAFLLGCNHPIWPSLGLIHGSRSSMDITRDWHHISKTGRENLLRGWQNGRLWWNDPDCLVLNRNHKEELSAEDSALFQFHATLIYATGGMLLTGDDMSTYGNREQAMLRKLFPPTGRCMAFVDTQFTLGMLRQPNQTMVALFRWDDSPAQLLVPVDSPCEVFDYWTDTSLGIHDKPFLISMPKPRTARLFKLVPRKE